MWDNNHDQRGCYLKIKYFRYEGVFVLKKIITIIVVAFVIVATVLLSSSMHSAKVTNQRNDKITASQSKVIIPTLAPISVSTPTPVAPIVSEPSTSVAPIVASSIKLNETSLSLSLNQTAQLTATLSPDGAANKITWSSDDRYTVSVDQNGKITALVGGVVNIYATSDNGLKAICKVTVKTPAPAPAVTPAPAQQPAAPVVAPKVQQFHGSAFDGSSQIVVVAANGINSTQATLKTYQKSSNGAWELITSVGACVGRDGLVEDSQRIEGDMRTPIGVYGLTYAFGWASKPPTGLPYRTIDGNTYFDGQYGSPTYGGFVESKPNNNEYEYMNIGAYKYGAYIDFNHEQKVGKGNAIFLHIGNPSGYTAGCVGISEGNLVQVLGWLNQNQNPKILICLSCDLSKYFY